LHERGQGRWLRQRSPSPSQLFDQAIMSYGPNIPDDFRRLAELVDQVLRGANPAEMPIEQVMRLDFIINLRTARTLG
jgi:putative ABC transport system substrate-binding protein